MSNRERPSVALCGFMRSGKDSVARYLDERCGYIKLSFADALKEDCATMLASVAGGRTRLEWLKELKDGPMKESLRPLMQWYGAWRRENYGEDYWVTRVEAQINDLDFPVVVTDARYTNELTMLKRRGFVVIELRMAKNEVLRHLISQGVSYESAAELLQHPSENEWQEFPKDYSFVSEMGNLPRLTEKVVQALGIRSEDESIVLELEEFFHKLYPDKYLAPEDLYAYIDEEEKNSRYDSTESS